MESNKNPAIGTLWMQLTKNGNSSLMMSPMLGNHILSMLIGLGMIQLDSVKFTASNSKLTYKYVMSYQRLVHSKRL
jgi:hypothetical protein